MQSEIEHTLGRAPSDLSPIEIKTKLKTFDERQKQLKTTWSEHKEFMGTLDLK